MNEDEKKQFDEFAKEVKKYDFIPQDLMIMLISRYSRFIRKVNVNPRYRVNYYSKYWCKILTKVGILIPRGLGYKVVK